MERVTEKTSKRFCPACKSELWMAVGDKNLCQLVTCRDCQTLYMTGCDENPAQDYDSYYSEDNLTVPAFIHRRLDEIVRTFRPYRKQNRLLDVGFGAASLLEAAARDGWQAFGVEISEPAIIHARARGFEVSCGELDDAGYAEGYFDVVVASELLEHLPDPHVLLSAISRVLRPGGLFWATTPHGRGLSARLLRLNWSAVAPPEHLQLFSLQGLRKGLKEHGFAVSQLSTRGINPFEIAHTWKSRLRTSTSSRFEQSAPEAFNRVESSYQINKTLSEKASGRTFKSLVNWLLTTARLGDSITIRALKSS